MEKSTSNITFNHIGGYGYIHCKDCDHKENVTGALHNPGTSEAIQGFQCQNCGVFRVLSFPVDPDKMTCNCGGDLSRKETVFCPKCKSKNLTYRMKFIT